MKHEMRHLSYVSDKLDQGNVCPACPEVIWTLYVNAPFMLMPMHARVIIGRWQSTGWFVWTSS